MQNGDRFVFSEYKGVINVVNSLYSFFSSHCVLLHDLNNSTVHFFVRILRSVYCLVADNTKKLITISRSQVNLQTTVRLFSSDPRVFYRTCMNHCMFFLIIFICRIEPIASQWTTTHVGILDLCFIVQRY